MKTLAEPKTWDQTVRRAGRRLALAVVVQTVAIGWVGWAYVRQAGRPPEVVAVSADGHVWAGERRPFRPDGRMIEAWVRKVVGTLAVAPAEAGEAGWASPAVVESWERARGPGVAVTWRESQVHRQGPEGLVLDLRLGWPTGATGWAEERRVRLEVGRTAYSRTNPLGLFITSSTWLTEQEYEAREREQRRQRRLEGVP